MARSRQRHQSPQPPADTKDTAGENTAIVPSPTRTDGSSDSERGVVREKLKETRIDGQYSSVDQPASQENAAINGAVSSPRTEEQGTSGSESSERGRLQRKRSFEDFEEEQDKDPKKERHTRKKSRDIHSPRDESSDDIKSSFGEPVTQPSEDHDETMQSFSQEASTNRQLTPETQALEKEVTSPKNKRSRETYLEGQTKSDVGGGSLNGTGAVSSTEGPKKAQDGADEERHPKRHRDKNDPTASTEEEKSSQATKIPPGSGFSNSSSTSPFAALSPPPNSIENAKDLPQTSDEKFKTSGFSSFAKAGSPLNPSGGSGASSPFATAAPGQKLSSFASPPSNSDPPASGFGALNSKPSSFGGSVLGAAKPSFGGSLSGGFGSGFGGLPSAKPGGMTSFATPGQSGISGLSNKPAKPFGAPKDLKDESGSEEGDEDDEDGIKSPATENAEERQDSRFYEQEIETGEENEEALFVGKAKLYSYVIEGDQKAWKERGVGTFRFNVTKDSPKKARFVLRSEQTKKVVLNAGVNKDLKFGNAAGEEPKDGRLLFIGPKEDGSGLEQKLLRMREEPAKELYHCVHDLQTEL